MREQQDESEDEDDDTFIFEYLVSGPLLEALPKLKSLTLIDMDLNKSFSHLLRLEDLQKQRPSLKTFVYKGPRKQSKRNG